MDKKYIDFFKELTRSVEIIAEKAMDIEKETSKGNAAQIMRDDYAALNDRFDAENFDPATLTKADYSRLFVGSTIVAAQLEKQKQSLDLAIKGYHIDVIPKLERMINETNDDKPAEMLQLANELFSVKNEN